MRNRKRLWWLLAIPIVLVVVAVGGTFVYIHFVKGDAPAPLTFADLDASSSTTTLAGGTTVPATGNGIEGTWKIAGSSQVGYRVDEVLFGQKAQAVGRTSSVEGTIQIDATTVQVADFEVNLKTVKSDQSNRDSQFQGRIMNTASFPTAKFELTEPIALGSVPADGVEISVKATGDLTLHGKTKSVTFTLKARRNNGNIEVNGSIPITFSDYGIPNPTFGPASVGDKGDLEFLLVFSKAA